MLDNKKPPVQSGDENLVFRRIHRRAVTLDLYGCLLNFKMIPHLIGQIARDNGLVPELAENYFMLYLNRVMYAEPFRSYRFVLSQTMLYLDMVLNTRAYSRLVGEVYLMHQDLRSNPEVLNCLQDLKTQGYELYLLADCDLPLAMKAAKHQLDHLFTEKQILVSDEVKCYKPDLNFFKAANEKFHLRSADHFHVTSNYFTDVVPTAKMRIDTVYVNRAKTGLHAEFKPAICISNMTDLYDAMIQVRQRQAEEERLAQEHEMIAQLQARKAQLVARQQAELQRRQAMLASQQQKIMDQQEQQLHPEAFCIRGMHGRKVSIVPKTDADYELVESLRHMSPAKARAVMLARERALANSRSRMS